MVGNVNVTAEKVIFLDIDGVLNDEGDHLKKGVYRICSMLYSFHKLPYLQTDVHWRKH